MKVVTVSERLQIAIPKEVADQLGIEKGNKLGISVDNGKIVMEKVFITITKAADQKKILKKPRTEKGQR